MKPVPVTGWGMVSALGADVVTSCAAARAGMRRARQLPELMLADPANGDDAPPTGHPIDLLTHGFEGVGRLLRLLVAGLEDVARQSWPAEPQGPARREALLYLAVPEPGRIYTDLDEIEDAEVKQGYEQDKAEAEPESCQELAETLLGVALPLLGWTMPMRLAFVGCGHAGFAEALARAAADQVRAPGLCIVGGVDSLLDDSTLQWLHHRRLLKYAGNPVGLEPGEAAAFVVLDGARDATAERSPGLPEIAVMNANVLPIATTGADGVSLAHALASAQESAGLQGPPSWLSVDLDGTTARTSAWGDACVRMAMRWPGCSPGLQLPALSFGDTGAAAGAVATCLALAGWSRGWAAGSSCTVVTSERTRISTHVLAETGGRRGAS